MKPSQVRKQLTHRLEYLRARLEREPEAGPARWWRSESEALESALRILAAFLGEETTEQVEQRERARATARASVEQMAARCTCERCPLHGGERG